MKGEEWAVSSEAKLQIAQIEVERMIPQVQNINDKIANAPAAYGALKKFFK